MKDTRMKPLDAVWLLMESPDTPMHIGVMAIFQKPGDAPDDYLSQLARQMRDSKEPVPPWNYRLATRQRAPARPRLLAVRDFDLDYHFRHLALPEPGGERELGVMVSRLHSQALDRKRPLWEFHLIEGLEQDRFALYVKVHHALVDNVNGITMLMSALSVSAEQQNMQPLWSLPLRSRVQGDGVNISGDPPQGGAPPGGAPSKGSGTEGVRASRPPLSTLARAATGLLRAAFNPGASGSFLLPRGTPHSTLNRRINAQRRLATQQFELARIERLAEAADSTLIEILVYLCGSSLRRFFKEYNVLPDKSLIGLMPLSMQDRSDDLSGNAIAANRVILGTHIGNSLARLDAVKASIKAVRDDCASLPEEGVSAYSMMRSAPIYASQMRGIEYLIPPLFNLRVSTTVGSQQPLYLNGSRLEAIYPVSHLLQFSALSVGFVTYADTLNISFTGARDTLPHLQRMAVYFGKAVSDLEELLYQEENMAEDNQ